MYKPNGDEFTIVDHAVRMRVSIDNEEENDYVDEESNLAGDIEKEQIFRESSEEAKLQWSEEGGVHRPYQNELRPQYVPPAFKILIYLLI